MTQVHIPFALGAIAVFHSVPTGEIGGESLKLDACLLAKIFGGAITTWDHADIKAYLGYKQTKTSCLWCQQMSGISAHV